MLTFSACVSDNESTTSKNTTKVNVHYSFAVAGHVYGAPGDSTLGIYEPFKHQFEWLNNYPKIDLIAFTGDYINYPDSANWLAFEKDLKALDFPKIFAPGNHDKGGKLQKWSSQSYSCMLNKGDLFITLSPKDWNIEGAQLQFLDSILQTHRNDIHNVFIFVHELIWWSPNGKYKDIAINYLPHYPGKTNYWEDVDPLLRGINKPVYLFAGDVGASPVVSPNSYHHYNNVHLISSGMGSGSKDNFLVVSIDDQHHVTINKVTFTANAIGNIINFKPSF